MKPEQFDRVAHRFERISTAWPGPYRAFVAALGLAGFAFLGLWIVGTLALLAGLVGLSFYRPNVFVWKAALAVGVLAIALLRATWVRMERPAGVALAPTDAPALFEEIARLRALGRIPRIHRVVVDDRLNAAVAQTPRLGILGWPHNDLVLGYPLLAALSPDELRAVLAHELGHLSGRHGKVGAWSYRVRQTWAQLLGALESRRSALTGLFRSFLSVYGPWFSAASLALAREQEREADRFAAVATSPRAAADALAAVRVAEWAVERRHVEPLRRSVARLVDPPDSHLAPLQAAVREGMAEPGAEVVLEKALRARSRGVDTHPSLGERLAALGEPPRVPPRPVVSAAEALLGEAHARVRAELERRWRVEMEAGWAQAHRDATEALGRLAGLEERAAREALPADEALDRALLVERYRGADEALPLVRSLAAAAPDHAAARFHAGRLLLDGGDPDGVAHLERAMAIDPAAAPYATELIARHHLEMGRNDEATTWIGRLDEVAAVQAEAVRERSQAAATDAVGPHRLPAGEVETLVAPLRGRQDLRRAYLGRKVLRRFPDRDPVYVLGVVARWPWWRPISRAELTGLAERVAGTLGGPLRVFVFVKGSSTRGMIRRLRRLPGSTVI